MSNKTNNNDTPATTPTNTNSGFGWGALAGVALVAVLLGGSGVAAFNGCNSDAPVAKTPAPAEEIARVAKPIPGADMRGDCSDAVPATICRVNYMKQYKVAVVDIIGDDGDREQFRVFSTLNDQGNLTGRRGECEGVEMTDSILMDLINGETRCSASAECQVDMFDDCKDDRPEEEKAQANSDQDEKPDVNAKPNKDNAMTVAESALDAAERAQKTADKSLSVGEANSTMLEDLQETVSGIAAFIKSLAPEEEADEPQS